MQTISSPISQTSDTDKEQLPQISYIPLLQKALDGLDTSLDEELDRYRHWQENGQTFSYLNPFRSPSRFNINGSSANAASDSPQLPKMSLPSMLNVNQAAKNVGDESSYSSYQGNPESQHSNVKSPQPPVNAHASFAAPNSFEHIAATTLDRPNSDLVHPNEEMSEDDLFEQLVMNMLMMKSSIAMI
ncbi:MAG: hypothetical protein HC935_01465 [Pseudanabaena sp. SU_2_4]|nr:hypothetical protein [Pseudanabaena sp. SU_2_4]